MTKNDRGRQVLAALSFSLVFLIMSPIFVGSGWPRSVGQYSGVFDCYMLHIRLFQLYISNGDGSA
jgi:hypothetical protein